MPNLYTNTVFLFVRSCIMCMVHACQSIHAIVGLRPGGITKKRTGLENRMENGIINRIKKGMENRT